MLTGQSTSIPFRSFGVDPDGDDVSLDRIVTQPRSGSATISPDGESIVYASVPGFHGQVSFTFRVADAFGATGIATVRVGVLDEQANPSPVTFTDYVQLAGRRRQLRADQPAGQRRGPLRRHAEAHRHPSGRGADPPGRQREPRVRAPAAHDHRHHGRAGADQCRHHPRHGVVPV
ncbi:cadherin-like domain-containing protein [Microbacterium elymi]|uniref:Cadherin-like domain-containing protein n=1 Tax=Microbacterium elymi TaxID=2909587 RepID=A0ABY5NLF9_9MICO|nr:cadherin-like domain-containing protein [Microbacterium elymi]UUT35921.1 cadherin-like domain-containing protein [Microbacterium elymi]